MAGAWQRRGGGKTLGCLGRRHPGTCLSTLVHARPCVLLPAEDSGASMTSRGDLHVPSQRRLSSLGFLLCTCWSTSGFAPIPAPLRAVSPLPGNRCRGQPGSRFLGQSCEAFALLSVGSSPLSISSFLSLEGPGDHSCATSCWKRVRCWGFGE